MPGQNISGKLETNWTRHLGKEIGRFKTVDNLTFEIFLMLFWNVITQKWFDVDILNLG